MGQVGRRVREYETIPLPDLEIRRGIVRGRGRYVDAFGNILTNITANALERAFGDAPLAKIRATINNTIEVDGIKDCYTQGGAGELILILDSWGLIELSVNQGRAIDHFPDIGRLVVDLARV